MTTTTVPVSAADLELNGSYEPAGDALYLSAAGDDKHGLTQATPEGHAVRPDDHGRVIHLAAIMRNGH
jgi:hypothetical protein